MQIYSDLLKTFSFRHFSVRLCVDNVLFINVGSSRYAVGSDVDCNEN